MPLPGKVLVRYLNRVFVETGSLTGAGVKTALNVGFRHVYTTDIDRGLCAKVRAKFKGQPRVHVFNDASTVMLNRELPRIQTLMTFWLDAHPPGRLSIHDPAVPLLEELRCIVRHAVPGRHEILIDDMRIFDPDDIPFLEQRLREYWPGCEIGREDSQCAPRDIMSCRLP